ncbi:MAG TPA: phytoene/squalene synthase family protein [Xanthomonadaceae bacterium]|nr:phytoene/squalene synthase family protein [Xanthomonadaceae bacterium]
MTDHVATEFIAKWRARWPEWAIAEVFLQSRRRAPAQAWFALLQELGDAAWGGTDPRPGEAKLAWWAEELDGWGRGARRHPLGQVLMPRAASWAALAAALPTLQASRERPRDTTAAVGGIAPFALAGAAVEAELSGTPATTASSGDLASALLAERLLHHADGAVPLQLLAAGEARAGQAWAAALLETWPSGAPVARARRLHALLQRARLAQLARGVATPAPLPPWLTLWRAWRAARRDRRD